MKVAYFAYQYPTLTQTFIQREVAGLMKQGLELEIFPVFCPPSFMRKIDVPKKQKVHYGSCWDTVLFPFRLIREAFTQPELFIKGLKICLKRRFIGKDAWAHSFFGFVCAVNRANYIRKQGDFKLAHAAWATGPATAAASIAKLCDLPFSFGGHAYDIYRFGGDPFLDDKLTLCAFVHTTTASNVRYLKKRSGNDALNVVLARRGLPSLPDVTDPFIQKDETIKLLSVGRLVEKKGQTFLFKACSLLKERQIKFHLTLVGEGPLRQELENLRDQFGLNSDIKITGALKPEDVQALYKRSHIFIHSGIVDSQGDRDGVPNVIPEAFSHQLAVIGSITEGVMEAVQDNVTGLTVDPTVPVHIAEAIERLAQDEPLRKRLGEAGRKWVEENFLSEKNTMILGNAMKAVSEAS